MSDAPLSKQIAQSDGVPKATLRTSGGPADAHDYIIVNREKITVPGARIVTFIDRPELDFSRLTPPADSDRERYVYPRKPRGKPELTTLDDLRDNIKLVIIHSDMTENTMGCFRVLKMRGLSTHFGVDGDGTIFQFTDVMTTAVHAASDAFENVNGHSIGIDLNNLLPNYAKGGSDDPVGTMKKAGAGGPRPKSERVEINGVPWQSLGHTDEQYDALIALLRKLGDLFPKLKLAAPMNEKGEVIKTALDKLDVDNIGIYGHYHLTAQKFDPGPGMDWARLVQGLSNEHNSFPIDLEKGRSIANLLTEDKVRIAADRYFGNTEMSELGGYFPVGLNGQWHGGIHLHVPKGTPIKAMVPGHVVVAHSGEPTSLGSNNFVLLRHEVATAKKTEKFVFFSLYMHLRAFDLDDDDAPGWTRLLKQIKTGKEDDAAGGRAAGQPAPKPAPKDAPPGKPVQGVVKPKKKDKKGPSPDDELKPKEEDQPFLEVGFHESALRRGQVALFPLKEEERINVSAGDVIGYSDEFGDDEGTDEFVHVEIFADGSWRQVIDLLGVHGEFWYELEGDTGDDLLVDSAELLSQILPDTRRKASRSKEFLVARRKLVPDDVTSFFGDQGEGAAAKRRLRAAIVRHISEWSDQVDWLKAIAAAQGWDERVKSLRALLMDKQGHWVGTLFSRQIKRVLPFIWLNTDVAKHLEINKGQSWDGLLYYFHPIHFVIWLTFHSSQRIQVLSQGLTKEQLKKKKEREIKWAEQMRKQRSMMEIDGTHGEEQSYDLDPDVNQPKDVLKDLWEIGELPGEWKRKQGEDFE